MATLTIRNLPDDVRDALRVRAAKHGRSMEAEVREMLATMIRNGDVLPDREQALKRIEHARAMVAQRVKQDDRQLDGFISERLELWGHQ